MSNPDVLDLGSRFLFLLKFMCLNASLVLYGAERRVSPGTGLSRLVPGPLLEKRSVLSTTPPSL